MTKLSTAIERLKFDYRMVEWNYSEKLLTREEYQKYLDSLEDVSHRATKLTLEDDSSHSDTH